MARVGDEQPQNRRSRPSGTLPERASNFEPSDRASDPPRVATTLRVRYNTQLDIKHSVGQTGIRW
jgi:hypothetical protein